MNPFAPYPFERRVSNSWLPSACGVSPVLHLYPVRPVLAICRFLPFTYDFFKVTTTNLCKDPLARTLEVPRIEQSTAITATDQTEQVLLPRGQWGTL
jgi:hypothetical protein